MIGKMLQELIVARGAPAKIQVLKKYDSPEMREILLVTYNPDMVYHIRPNPVSPMNVFERTEPLNDEEYGLLVDLNARGVSGKQAHLRVDRVAKTYGPLIKLILGRDLQCGIAATTINKAYPGLIPQFKVQLAKEVPLDKVKFPCLAQLKYDGVRIVITKHGSIVRIRTRNGKTVDLPNIRQAVREAPFDMMMLDGELTLKGGKMTERTAVSGMVNSAMHGGRIDESKLVFNIFDCMSVREFETCKCDTIYSERLKHVKLAVSVLPMQFMTAETYCLGSAKGVTEMATTMYENGEEGIILKHATHKYSFKRSRDWVKIKEIKTADLTVHTWQEGAGKYEGMIGALYCKGYVEGKHIGVFVGSGLSDAQRDMDPNYYVDKTIEIKYNSIIMDSRTSEWSLFLPRFVCVRLDK